MRAHGHQVGASQRHAARLAGTQGGLQQQAHSSMPQSTHNALTRALALGRNGCPRNAQVVIASLHHMNKVPSVASSPHGQA
eukprot:CAMPEP_0202904216 /NCGR_PEP_ID=MMETSP1392-20130828/28342_1 /ASSEMBLY_ACC=CAM_ASM_000868 /TAXON_ID=225041 /ORGANISM="Chlamydomonas chlamydogama, Strain SAG 11-48b" /LENGTH=80 /DNA_ID=CAMNT_0049591743 /DNA_START=23 /DNA_END=266 /DNA_ORIENTATION=+